MTLSAIVLRFEERFAMLGNESLGEFRWPMANLPEGLKIGDTVRLNVAGQHEEKEVEHEKMRRLLEELIN